MEKNCLEIHYLLLPLFSPLPLWLWRGQQVIWCLTVPFLYLWGGWQQMTHRDVIFLPSFFWSHVQKQTPFLEKATSVQIVIKRHHHHVGSVHAACSHKDGCHQIYWKSETFHLHGKHAWRETFPSISKTPFLISWLFSLARPHWGKHLLSHWCWVLQSRLHQSMCSDDF